LAVTRYQVSVPFGVVNQTADGVFGGIREKPVYPHLISAGIYYLTPALRALAPQNQAFDMPEILASGNEAGLKIGLFPVHENWRDMGQPDDFKAEQEK
jgi:NDP-sugar pyrophosphorylase family protein